MQSDTNISNANIVIEGALRDHAATFKIFDIPPGSMSIVLNAALGKIKAQGPGALARLSAGSSIVSDAVRTGFSAVYGNLTETQKQTMLDAREAAGRATEAPASS
jgi:hypothetical protein